MKIDARQQLQPIRMIIYLIHLPVASFSRCGEIVLVATSVLDTALQNNSCRRRSSVARIRSESGSDWCEIKIKFR